MGLNYFQLKGVPQSKDAPFELYSEKIRLHEFKQDRRDLQTVTNILFTDAQGYLRSRPISDLNSLSFIKTLNDLSDLNQTMSTTETGTDFSISNDASAEHLFNLPVASALATGKLHKDDWVRFNSVASYEFNNGITLGSEEVKLGGALNQNTKFTGTYDFEINPYDNTYPALFIRGTHSQVGIRTKTPRSYLDIDPPFLGNDILASFGTVSIQYGQTSNDVTLKIGSDFLFARNGTGNPTITSSQTIRSLSDAFSIEPYFSGGNPTLKLVTTSGNTSYFGTSQNSDSSIQVGNISSSTTYFTYKQTIYFNNSKLSISNGTAFANASCAMIELNSTTQGILPSRMTSAQKSAIVSPVNGLIVYDTTTNKLCAYAGGSWVDLH